MENLRKNNQTQVLEIGSLLSQKKKKKKKPQQKLTATD
jgi:hypothetical protein